MLQRRRRGENVRGGGQYKRIHKRKERGLEVDEKDCHHYFLRSCLSVVPQGNHQFSNIEAPTKHTYGLPPGIPVRLGGIPGTRM